MFLKFFPFFSAIQTLQKLHEALIAQQRQQQQKLAQLLIQQLQQPTPTSVANCTADDVAAAVTANGDGSPRSEGTPLGSPEFNLPEDSSAVESEKDLSQDNIRLVLE